MANVFYLILHVLREKVGRANKSLDCSPVKFLIIDKL